MNDEQERARVIIHGRTATLLSPGWPPLELDVPPGQLWMDGEYELEICDPCCTATTQVAVAIVHGKHPHRPNPVKVTVE
jgi:hypothetical protein